MPGVLVLSAAAIDGGVLAGQQVAEAQADTRALRRLTLLILAGLACTLFIFTFMLLASFQAVSMIDDTARNREAAQVARYIAAVPGGMNEVTLDAMRATLGLRGSRITRIGAVGAGEMAVSLGIGSDRVVAWTPQLYGSSTFEVVAPLRIGGGIVFVAVVAVIGWRVVVVSNRLDRRRAAATRLAHTDTLTGLGNRRAFDVGLERRCAEDGPGVVLVMIDLDDFKAINDAFGHSAGDAVLQIVGRHLRETAHRDDLVVRLGGDEFAVVRSATGLDEYLATLDARLDEPIDIGSRRLKVGASIGMARSQDFPGSTARLIQAADIALYRAKRNGPGNAELAIPPRRTAA